MATSARRRTEAGGQEARHEDSVRHAEGGGGAPSLARTPGAVSAAAAQRAPSLPAHGGASTGPVPAPSRGPARGLWPRRWAAGRAAPSSRTGWAGQDNLAGGNAAKSQPRAPGPRTGTRAPCTAVTRQHARRPGTPGTPRSPCPSRALRPGAASGGFPLAAPRPQTQPAERPPADPREDGVGCGGHPTGGPGAPQPLRG